LRLFIQTTHSGHVLFVFRKRLAWIFRMPPIPFFIFFIFSEK
jgi:hypothetical protein